MTEDLSTGIIELRLLFCVECGSELFEEEVAYYDSAGYAVCIYCAEEEVKNIDSG